MKRSEEFIKRKIGTRYVIVAVGKAAKKFSGMISVNGTGSAIWDLLESDMTEEQVVDALLLRYEIDRTTALSDTREFLASLKEVGAIVE